MKLALANRSFIFIQYGFYNYFFFSSIFYSNRVFANAFLWSSLLLLFIHRLFCIVYVCARVILISSRRLWNFLIKISLARVHNTFCPHANYNDYGTRQLSSVDCFRRSDKSQGSSTLKTIVGVYISFFYFLYKVIRLKIVFNKR